MKYCCALVIHERKFVKFKNTNLLEQIKRDLGVILTKKNSALASINADFGLLTETRGEMLTNT